jgi:hypothetical protein
MATERVSCDTFERFFGCTPESPEDRPEFGDQCGRGRRGYQMGCQTVFDVDGELEGSVTL